MARMTKAMLEAVNRELVLEVHRLRHQVGPVAAERDLLRTTAAGIPQRIANLEQEVRKLVSSEMKGPPQGSAGRPRAAPNLLRQAE